jgi:hypothetical protein
MYAISEMAKGGGGVIINTGSEREMVGEPRALRSIFAEIVTE